ncbi:MAG: conjugal transfer protein TraX [Clostridia bacterium]|nr:conjugal transfer protein TraX [Clostridia bacterium]
MTKRALPVNSPLIKIPFGGLKKEWLQLMAVLLMLSDHIWATYMSFGNWMTYIGRMAFPVFAFLIAEGFHRTSDRRKYALRLLISGIISEIPFNLFYSSRYFNPYHQNVMFTLLLGLLALTVIDRMKKDRTAKSIALSLLYLLLIAVVSVIGFVDYGFSGVMMVVIFGVFRNFPFAWLLQLVGMVLINIVFFEGQVIPVTVWGVSYEVPTQAFAVFSLVPIWLYGGRKCKSNKAVQYGFYAFYPVHMLILYLIKHFA